MGASIIEICNLALLRLGGDEIQSLNEKSKEANYCRRFYDRCRRSTLRRHPWGFATRINNNLTPLAVAQPDYAFAFALPAGLIRVVRVTIAGSQEEIPYTVREDKVLVTDYETPILEYISDIVDPNSFDDQFIEVMTHLLASEIAVPLTGKPSLQKTEYQMFQLTMASAVTTDSAESNVDLNLNQSIVEARN